MAKRFRPSITRRSFLTGAARTALGVGLSAAALGSTGAGKVAAAEARGVTGGHLAWVWQFSDDGSPDRVRSVLAANGVGIILKTHDATSWMSRYDHSDTAISGPSAIAAVASYFEAGGVPFHAWCVVKGLNPQQEAIMAAEVLSAGARSLVLDLEPSDGGSFWEGTPDDALAFGRQFRRLQPSAWLSIAPDPRPWQVEAVPAAEFATFSNEFAPQTYWDTFDNSPTKRMLRERGFAVGADGITPELTLDFTHQSLARFGLPIRPVGQGTSDPDSWRRFIGHAFNLGMGAVSVWRFGTSRPDVWSVLGETPARVAVQPKIQNPPQAVVRPAATLPDPTPPRSFDPQSQSKPASSVPANQSSTAGGSPETKVGPAFSRAGAVPLEVQRSTGWRLNLPGFRPLR